MPTADFQDDITKEVFEVFFKTHPIPDKTVNEKTNNPASRIYSGNLGFEFKGSGFYETDYKRKQ